MNIEDLKNNKAFCLHPWRTQIKNSLGHIKLCPTRNDFDAHTADLKEAWNCDSIKELRSNMLNGIQTEYTCKACYKLDNENIPSDRIKSFEGISDVEVKQLLSLTKDGEVSIGPEYLELSLDIECKSLCVQCNRQTSQQWKDTTPFLVENAAHRVIKADFRTRHVFNDSEYTWSNQGKDFWNTFWDVIPEVKDLYLSGGEPFDSVKTLRLIAELSTKPYAKDINLIISTTGKFIPEDLWDKFTAFKNVKLQFSVDAVKEKAEWLRFPLQWNDFVNNVRLADDNGISYEFITNIHSLNLPYVPEIYEWLWDSKLKNLPAHPIKFTFNHRPSYLDVRFVEQDTKQYINQKIWDFYGANNSKFDESYFQDLMGCLDFMWQHKDERRNRMIREFVNTIDKTRNTKFGVLFSELDEKL
jgi:hypothetical protein